MGNGFLSGSCHPFSGRTCLQCAQSRIKGASQDRYCYSRGAYIYGISYATFEAASMSNDTYNTHWKHGQESLLAGSWIRVLSPRKFSLRHDPSTLEATVCHCFSKAAPHRTLPDLLPIPRAFRVMNPNILVSLQQNPKLWAGGRSTDSTADLKEVWKSFNPQNPVPCNLSICAWSFAACCSYMQILQNLK